MRNEGSHGLIGILSTQAHARVRRQHEVKAISTCRFGIKKGFGYYKEPSMGKIRANWEGPYHITSMARIGAYYLEDLDENVVPRRWNVNNL